MMGTQRPQGTKQAAAALMALQTAACTNTHSHYRQRAAAHHAWLPFDLQRGGERERDRGRLTLPAFAVNS